MRSETFRFQRLKSLSNALIEKKNLVSNKVDNLFTRSLGKYEILFSSFSMDKNSFLSVYDYLSRKLME